MREAIANNNKEETQKLLPKTFTIIDKCVKKGVIHENKGNRTKSRLMKQAELINPTPAK